MKVYSLPTTVPFAEPDYAHYDFGAETKRQQDHQAALAAHLKTHGYAGSHTGRILSVPIGDGRAEYMFADAGAKSCLIHLPYGDAYQSPDVQYLPKAEVLRRLDQNDKLLAIFKSKRAS